MMKIFYVQYNPISLKHPELGLLKFLACPTHAITIQGDLYLFNLQPLDMPTSEACLQLTRNLGTQPMRVASWPKPPTPTGTLRL